MENIYDEQKIKSILESPPDLSPQPADEEDMRRRLQFLPKAPHRRYFWWLWLLLPFILGGVYLGWRLLELEAAYTELNRKILETRRVDTLFSTQTIYQVDTVYRTIYQQRIQKVYVPTFNYQSVGFRTQRSTAEFPGFWARSKESLGVIGTFGGASLLPPLRLSVVPNISVVQDASSRWGTLDTILAKKPILISLDQTKKWGLQKWVEQEESGVKPIYYFQPKEYSLGIEGSPVMLPTHVFGGTGFLVGLTGTIDFPAGQSLEVGLHWLKTNFETKDPSTFEQFPVVQGPSASDVLYEIKDYAQYIQIPIRIGQAFRVGKKFQPRLMAGLVAYRPINHRLEYEFNTANAEEVKLEEIFRGSSWQIDQLELGVGAKVALWKNWQIQTNLRFQQGLSIHADDYVKIGFWSFNIGIQRIFGKN